MRFDAHLDNLSRIRAFIRQEIANFDPDEACIGDLILAVNEVATNIIEHGYQNHVGFIEVDVRCDADIITVCLRDHAPLFDPTKTNPPDLSLPLERRPLGKVGIYLTKELMDEVHYRVTSQGHNELTLKRKKAS